MTFFYPTTVARICVAHCIKTAPVPDAQLRRFQRDILPAELKLLFAFPLFPLLPDLIWQNAKTTGRAVFVCLAAQTRFHDQLHSGPDPLTSDSRQLTTLVNHSNQTTTAVVIMKFFLNDLAVLRCLQSIKQRTSGDPVSFPPRPAFQLFQLSFSDKANFPSTMACPTSLARIQCRACQRHQNNIRFAVIARLTETSPMNGPLQNKRAHYHTHRLVYQ